MSIRVLIACLLSVFWLNTSQAAIDVYDFKTPAEEQRFQALIGELRCPKCQNQNLAGSEAPIAKDLKDRTYQLMQEGKSDNEIRDYMVDRYGDFISYKPPVRSTTYLLWFGPFILLFTVILVIVVRRRQTKPDASALTPEESARLAALLKRNSND